MAATQNYSLPLPQLGEPADIRVLDQGTEMIDGIMHGNRTMIAPGWVSTETYNTGNRVVYLGEYYKCKEDNVTGAWDATKWDKTTVGEDIEGLGTGGSSALADLDDVEITNPSTGQALLFDDDDDVWKNQTLPDPSVTKEASGNPIELTDAADAPMVKCMTQITGSQDLHGYDKPWVGGAGKNKLPLVLADIKARNTSGTWSGNTYTINNASFTVNTDNDGNVTSINVNTSGAASDNSTLILYYDTSNCPFNGYRLSGAGSGSSASTYDLRVSDVDVASSVDWGGSVVINLTNTGKWRCSILVRNGATASNVVFYPMICSTSESVTFQPYSNICPITAYTEGEIEVRGKNLLYGKVDNSNIVNNGTIVTSSETDFDIHYAKVKQGSTYTITDGSASSVYAFFSTVPTTGTQSYNQSRTVEENHTFTAPIDGYVGVRTAHNYATPQLEEGESATPYSPYTSTTHSTTYPSAIYRGTFDAVRGKMIATHKVVNLGDYTWTYDSQYQRFQHSFTDMKEYAPRTNEMVCSALEVISDGRAVSAVPDYSVYSGSIIVNVTYLSFGSDTASFQTAMNGVQLVYELATPIEVDLTPTAIRSLSGYNHIESSTGDMEIEYITEGYQPLVDLIQSGTGHTYSTSEQVVGKWIDGSTVYERTFDKHTSPVSMSALSWHNFAAVSEAIEVLNVVGINVDSGNISASYPMIGAYDSGYLQVMHMRSGVTIDFGYVIAQYLKPSSNRSVSLTRSVAPISEETETSEELPFEPENAVEKPETEEENDER